MAKLGTLLSKTDLKNLKQFSGEKTPNPSYQKHSQPEIRVMAGNRVAKTQYTNYTVNDTDTKYSIERNSHKRYTTVNNTVKKTQEQECYDYFCSCAKRNIIPNEKITNRNISYIIKRLKNCDDRDEQINGFCCLIQQDPNKYSFLDDNQEIKKLVTKKIYNLIKNDLISNDKYNNDKFMEFCYNLKKPEIIDLLIQKNYKKIFELTIKDRSSGTRKIYFSKLYDLAIKTTDKNLLQDLYDKIPLQDLFEVKPQDILKNTDLEILLKNINNFDLYVAARKYDQEKAEQILSNCVAEIYDAANCRKNVDIIHEIQDNIYDLFIKALKNNRQKSLRNICGNNQSDFCTNLNDKIIKHEFDNNTEQFFQFYSEGLLNRKFNAPDISRPESNQNTNNKPTEQPINTQGTSSKSGRFIHTEEEKKHTPSIDDISKGKEHNIENWD